jgi:hypothetical protein
MKKRPNRRKLAQFLGRQKLDAVTRTPAILYFPPEVLERLNALCVEFHCSPLELIMEALSLNRTVGRSSSKKSWLP